MKVAIIVAGAAGLACAFQLHKNGIKPTIFEEKSWLGETLEFSALELTMFQTPMWNPLKYLKKHYGIAIKPHYPLEHISIYTATESHFLTGYLGHIVKRGNNSFGADVQIFRLFHPEIIYGKRVDVEDIKQDFEAVVVSTASFDTAKKLNVFTSTFDAWVRIASINGSFETNRARIWFNTKYANKGFAYSAPHDEKKATLTLIASNIKQEELDKHWGNFLNEEGLVYEITDIKDLRHNVGTVSPVKIGNVYLVGHAGGGIDDVLGFGLYPSILSGAIAGDAIAHNLDYNKLVKPLMKDFTKKHELRKIIDTFDNNSFDKLMNFTFFPGVKQLTHLNPYFRVTQLWPFAKMYNLFKGQ